MKSLIALALLALAGCALPSAGNAPAAPVSPLVGDYAGTWKGGGRSGGDVSLRLSRPGSGDWSAEMELTFEGAKIPAKLKSVRVEGNRVEMAFSLEIQGTPLVTRMTGELSGTTLQGKYESDVAEGAAAGTWSVTRR